MNNVKSLRLSKELQQSKVARAIGISQQVYSHYENGSREMPSEIKKRLAKFFGVTVEYLFESDFNIMRSTVKNIENLPKLDLIPLLGTITCSTPITTKENVAELVSVAPALCASFAVRCTDDSMINARIYNGDLVYIRTQDCVNDGEIAAILINNKAILRTVFKVGSTYELRPENPLFETITVESSRFFGATRILGVAMAFTSRLI